MQAAAAVQVDAVAVVSAPEAVQRERVLARPGMAEERLTIIMERQVPDAQKRAKADFVINTVMLWLQSSTLAALTIKRHSLITQECRFTRCYWCCACFAVRSRTEKAPYLGSIALHGRETMAAHG
jgi:hypothetical protein